MTFLSLLLTNAFKLRRFLMLKINFNRNNYFSILTVFLAVPSPSSIFTYVLIFKNENSIFKHVLIFKNEKRHPARNRNTLFPTFKGYDVIIMTS